MRLCRFSIDTASLYLNNVFGDICPRLHGTVSVLSALGASRTLFCFVLCEGRRRERKTLLSSLQSPTVLAHVFLDSNVPDPGLLR